MANVGTVAKFPNSLKRNYMKEVATGCTKCMEASQMRSYLQSFDQQFHEFCEGKHESYDFKFSTTWLQRRMHVIITLKKDDAIVQAWINWHAMGPKLLLQLLLQKIWNYACNVWENEGFEEQKLPKTNWGPQVIVMLCYVYINLTRT